MSAALGHVLAHLCYPEQQGGCQVGDLAHHHSPPACHGGLEVLQRAAVALHPHPVNGMLLLLLAETPTNPGL